MERDRTRRPLFELDDAPQAAKIKVIGLGGGGGNAVSRMMAAQFTGVEFIVANTDMQALRSSPAPVKVQLGSKLTQGLGAGSIQPVSVTIVGDLYPGRERLRIQAWVSAIWAIAAIAGPVVGGVIVQQFSWSWIFWMNVPAGVITIIGFIALRAAPGDPLLATANTPAQRKLGKYWKKLQRMTYVIWAFVVLHLVLLDGFTPFGAADGDGIPIFHQRFYQAVAVSIPLIVLRLPAVRRWIVERRAEGRQWLVWLAVSPLAVFYITAMAFIVNEEIFTGTMAITLNPPAD